MSTKILPLARLTDPAASHKAAERAAGSVMIVRRAVLEMVAERGHITGVVINRRYARLRAEKGWPVAAPDSPRKRAGELAKLGLIVDCSEADEFAACYIITDAGLLELEVSA